jgi:RNA polymerase sigma-70 factor (ECF subfamily)
LDVTPDTGPDDLLRRARAGDAAAVEHLVRRHELAILELVRGRMGATLRARASSRDLLQEALLGVAQALPREGFADEQHVLAFASVIVQRRLIDLLRRRRESTLDGLATTAGGVALASPTPGPATEAERHEEAQRLRRAVASLPEAERTIIELRDLEGLPFEEIAPLMERPTVKAVRLLHWRATRRLAVLLERGAGRERAADA